MDGAKPGALLGGRALIDHVLDAALTADLEVIVVAKPETPLPALLAVDVLYEAPTPQHPLAGIVTALQAGSGSAVLTLACDMPFVPDTLIARLAEMDGAVLLRAEGRVHPFPGRYPVAALPSLEHSLASELPLREALGLLGAREISGEELRAFGDPARICFNVNDPADLQAAEALLAG